MIFGSKMDDIEICVEKRKAISLKKANKMIQSFVEKNKVKSSMDDEDGSVEIKVWCITYLCSTI
jgi:hypothetical protein